MNQEFLNDVDAGLSASCKHLSSRYFYDEIGDKLFVEIMKMPEYYLTRAEFEIFQKQNDKLISSFGLEKETYFELVELGAGDGTKTKELLKVLLEEGYDFSYSPIDISNHALAGLKQDLNENMPALKLSTRQGDYFETLAQIAITKHPKVVLFLGSNLGNLVDKQAALFLKKLSDSLNSGDKLLLGVDLIKSADVVIPAYQDKAGITSRFNLNLLTRINRELSADFDITQFVHEAYYTEEEGIAKSFIISKIDQTVRIGALEKSFTFKKNEKIHVEISRKYNDEILANILKDTDFSIHEKLMDSKAYFADYIINRH